MHPQQARTHFVTGRAGRAPSGSRHEAQGDGDKCHRRSPRSTWPATWQAPTHAVSKPQGLNLAYTASDLPQGKTYNPLILLEFTMLLIIRPKVPQRHLRQHETGKGCFQLRSWQHRRLEKKSNFAYYFMAIDFIFISFFFPHILLLLHRTNLSLTCAST